MPKRRETGYIRWVNYLIIGFQTFIIVEKLYIKMIIQNSIFLLTRRFSCLDEWNYKESRWKKWKTILKRWMNLPSKWNDLLFSIVFYELYGRIYYCKYLADKFEMLYFGRRVLSVFESNDIPIRVAAELLDNVDII